MKLLSSAVSEETFCKYIGFHKAVKVLKYSPKCVFNDTSKCFLIYFEVSIFAVKYRGMFCSTPIRQANWEGSRAAFVCQQKNPQNTANSPQKTEGEKEGKQINTLGIAWELRKGGESAGCKGNKFGQESTKQCREWQYRVWRQRVGEAGCTLIHCHSTYFVKKEDSLQVSTAIDSAC